MRDSNNHQFCVHLTGSDPNSPYSASLMSGRRNHFVCDPRHWAGLFPGRLSARLVDLYRRYRREWLSLVERGLREGWKWSQMMVATQSEQMETQYA